MKGSAHDAISEPDFAAHVEAIVQDAAALEWDDASGFSEARTTLVELLREDHAIYAERSAAAIVRMRGWVLLALEKVGVRDPELLFVIEELDNGRDAYLIAAAARALRSYPNPTADFVSIVDQAIENIRYHDDSLNMGQYGGYGTDEHGATTTAVDELKRTRGWLKKSAASGPRAGGQKMNSPSPQHACCSARHPHGPESDVSCEAAIFEDQDGRSVGFVDFFRGKPSIVAFFYTRCNNPLKCSLTIAKLAKVQQVMIARGLSQRIRIAAITYDPEYDVPERLRGYAEDRAMRLNDEHRMLRAREHWGAVRHAFELGVNFVGSIVNRHRIEVFVLDEGGRIAASFERLRWSERELVARAEALLTENPDRQDPRGPPPPAPPQGGRGTVGSPVTCAGIGTLATMGAAFFPKCAMCWAAYVSAFGIVGLEHIPYAPWLLPVFIGLMIVNLVTLWPASLSNCAPGGNCDTQRASAVRSAFSPWRWLPERSWADVAAFALGAIGAVVIVWFGIGLQLSFAASVGVALTLAGSVLSVRSRIMHPRQRRLLAAALNLR